MRLTFVFFAAVTLCTSTVTHASEPARHGLYVGIELGASQSRSIRSTRTNVGIPTNCDQ